MAVVLMKKVTALLAGEAEEVVIGASGRVIEAVLYDFDGNVQNITGWSAQIVGTSDDLPGVSIDVAGEIVSPASGGTFRWTRVGDFLTQIGEKSSARFRCQVKWTDADGLVDYSHAFQITFVVDGVVNDGGAARQYGWRRFDAALQDLNGLRTVTIASKLWGEVRLLRLYKRTLRTSEVIGNFRAGIKRGE